LDGIRDELGVFLDDFLDLLFLQVLKLVFLEPEADFGTASEGRIDIIGSDGESATSSGLPDILLVVVVFRDNLDTLGDEVGRVETNTELTDHRDISTRAQSLHKTL
jgi:hypothetical protein